MQFVGHCPQNLFKLRAHIYVKIITNLIQPTSHYLWIVFCILHLPESAFEGATALLYRDAGSSVDVRVLIRPNGSLVAPPKGFDVQGRVYTIKLGKWIYSQ